MATTMSRKASRLPLTALALILSPILACATAAAAPQAQAKAERYEDIEASRDGIGKRYMGREIAAVMGPGMVVADIGAGTGYLTRRMAPAVIPGGKALAVDVQPEMVRVLQAMVRQTGLTQIQPLLGAEDNVRLPDASVDLAIMVDVYHELAYPYEMLASIARALRPGGLLVFVEFRAGDDSVPIKSVHKMSEAQVKREAVVHPLVWERTVATLPWQHAVFFRKRD